MDSCGRKDHQMQFVSLHLFQNGFPSNPEKLRVRRNEIHKFFVKCGRIFYYKGKALYTLSGEMVKSFGKIGDNSAYVVLQPHETFICCDYKEAFGTIMKKRQEQKIKFETKKKQLRCKSAPTIPSSCDNSMRETCGDENGKRKISIQHQHCVSMDKYPCCDQDSDSEEEAKPKTASLRNCPPNRKSSQKSPGTPIKSEKRGFFAKCCPCFSKKPKVRPSINDNSRPASRACGANNVKQTQTSPDDFERAKRCLKASMKEEKRRQKVYGKNKKSEDKVDCSEMRKLRTNQPNDCDKEKSEGEYKKARDKYRQKRKKMEQKINKSLEKEKRQEEKC